MAINFPTSPSINDIHTEGGRSWKFNGTGWDATIPKGENGWSPILAVVSDGERRVQQIVDWTGGEGAKPATGMYVGATGFEALIANGVDIRGVSGASSGDMLKVTYDTNNDGKVDAADTADSVPWTGVTSKPSTFPPDSHNHDDRYYTETETDALLGGKSNTGHTHAWGDITSKPTVFTPDTHTHVWADITDKPSTFTPSAHSHSISDITGLQAELDDKLETVGWTDVTGKPSTFPPDSHNHDDRYYTETETDSLLSGKAASSHTHAWSEITSKPSTFPPDAHSHDWASITDKPSTFAPSAHGHTASEITDFDTEVANNSAVTANTAKVSYTDAAKVAGIEANADVTDAENVGNSIHGATAKTTPVDADTVPLIDSAASNVLKKLSWANIKATLNTYFDTLYATGSHTHAWSAITDKPSTFPPSAHNHAGGDITSGTVAAARLGSGTPSSANFLRGDSTWQTLSGMVYPDAGIPVSTGSAWSSSKTNPSGAFVGTTDTQTLTNKTLTGYTETVFAITDAATVTPNPDNGTIQTWTLGANRTLNTGSIGAGQSILLMIDDGSARTITWTTVVWVGGSAPTLATSGYTCVELWKVGSTCYGALIGEVA